MNRTNRILTIAFCLNATTAIAAERELTVVPALDLAFKNSRYSFPTNGPDMAFKASYSTLVPSLTLSYGKFYGSANYDFTITESEQYRSGNGATPYFNTINYRRNDASLTLGYRVHPSINLFGGYTLGRGVMLASGYNTIAVPYVYSATRIYNAQGYYAGLGTTLSPSEKGILGLSAAYGFLDGRLQGASDSSSDELTASAPGYSLNLNWTHLATKTLTYRVGIKYTAYTFEGKELISNGVPTPLPKQPYNYDDRITTFYVGVVDSF